MYNPALGPIFVIKHCSTSVDAWKVTFTLRGGETISSTTYANNPVAALTDVLKEFPGKKWWREVKGVSVGLGYKAYLDTPWVDKESQRGKERNHSNGRQTRRPQIRAYRCHS